MKHDIFSVVCAFLVPPPIGTLSHPSSSTLCGDKGEEDAVNLSFLDIVVDALLEVLEVSD